MKVKTTAREFNSMTLAQKKKVLGEFTGTTVNQIVWGSLTNGCYGEFRIRHDGCAYSNVRINVTTDGKFLKDRDAGMLLTAWNFSTNEWQETI